ncbi:MAG: DUF302 domain-containing protein [Rhodomicrobium sp.]|nr:DUF302 domain-containing protein [Rhodomicrobium sp.]
MASNGVVTIASDAGPEETLGRLKSGIASMGLTLFAVIDHAKNAGEAGLSLRPSVVAVFGNAKAGTLLMQAGQASAIDLPLKVLVWQDAAGKTWISYNDPVWIAHRHGLPAEAAQIAGRMRDGLAALTSKAAGSL